MSAQLNLMGRTVGETRDELDRHFTPVPLAVVICREISKRVFRAGLSRVREPSTIIEPSVGAGAFARAARNEWPGARITGVDADPAAEGGELVDEFVLGDWTTLGWDMGPVDLVLGNPPFSGSTAIPHVEAALAVAEVVALILPWAPLGGVDRWEHLLETPHRPAFVWPVRPRPWGDKVRETALYVWIAGEPPQDTATRWLPRWK